MKNEANTSSTKAPTRPKPFYTCEVDGCTKLTWYAFKCQEHALAAAAKAPAPSPEQPAPDPKAWQTIASFVDKYAIKKGEGARFVQRLQEMKR
jgi:hypothetical protein